MDTGALYRGITVFAIQHYLENNSINIPFLSAILMTSA
jgi:cytidylate kinase